MVVLLCAVWAPLINSDGPRAAAAAAQQTRLVVFEAFMRDGCGFSEYAGTRIDAIAPGYAGQPVIFIEQDIDSTDPQFVARETRWWDAKGGGIASLPLVMVDSGKQFYSGVTDLDSTYRDMVDTTLTRPPQAEIEASWKRVGNSVRFDVQATNLSGVTLSTGNKATVWGFVIENAHIVNINHYVRAIASFAISSLAPGATGAYVLQTGDLPVGTDWTNLSMVVLVDYRPDPSLRPYDMLQAAFAQPEPRFTLQPESLTLMMDPLDAAPPSATVEVVSQETLSWSATTGASWLTITPASGTTTTKPTVSVVKAALSPGWQQAVITFTTTSGDPFSQTLTVHAYYGTLRQIFLPCVMR
jgi:hypothetical protein